MVTYEVTAIVDAALAADFERYMAEIHIPDVLATGHFSSATFSSDGGSYRIRYESANREKLETYFGRDADRLRDDVKKHFPEGIELSRRIWDMVAEFTSP